MAKPPRDALQIVHVVYSFRVGGLENGVVNLINRLPADRFRHRIISLTRSDPAFVGRLQQPVECIDLDKQPGHGLKLFGQMRTLLRALRPDVVHTRNLAALEMALPAWAAGVPVRIHGEHGRDVEDPVGDVKKYQWMRRAYRPFVTHYVALSRDLENYLVSRVGVPQGRVTRICNGVDHRRFMSSSARALPADAPFGNDGLCIVGTVGRMQAVKNHLGLVRAFARLRSGGDEAAQRLRLVIVGDGPVRPQVEALVDELGLREVVWLAGERSDVPALMQGMDVFVLPSLAEGISNTVLEAMASGLPVIASDVGGNPELVDPGVTGFLVPPADTEAWADAMRRLATGDAASRMGQAARLRVEQEFSLDRMVGQYQALYETHCGERRTA
ncbi:TIGR03088 family PEP-CTERM/XrtA system glycosyltransferase [Methyloversatilis sp.]|uniref:TIGR03088 family PEP-CTERM/XrtA system glycosyltransferase n=1 Tax=Methyloversatilis sp. TaxID=2569862 RepID=UPI003F71AE13